MPKPTVAQSIRTLTALIRDTDSDTDPLRLEVARLRAQVDAADTEAAAEVGVPLEIYREYLHHDTQVYTDLAEQFGVDTSVEFGPRNTRRF